MRISDWSSDVCSSDLRRSSVPRTALFSLSIRLCLLWLTMRSPRAVGARRARRDSMQEVREDSRSEERRVGKECVRRVDLGGRRILKKKITTTLNKHNN